MSQIQPSGVFTPSFTPSSDFLPTATSLSTGGLFPALPNSTQSSPFQSTTFTFPNLPNSTQSSPFQSTTFSSPDFLNPMQPLPFQSTTFSSPNFPNPTQLSPLQSAAATTDEFIASSPLLSGFEAVDSQAVDNQHFRFRRGADPRFIFRRGPTDPRFGNGGNSIQNRSTVALLEVGPDEPFQPNGKDGHDEAVQQVLKSFAPEVRTKTYSFYGLASGQSVSPQAVQRTADGTPTKTLDDINNLIDLNGYGSFAVASQDVREILRQDPSTDVINMSLGVSKQTLLRSIMDTAINNDPDTGRALAPQMGINPDDLNAYYNDPMFADPATRGNIQSQARSNIESALSAYVENRFEMPAENGLNFQSGLAEWQKATGELANRGVVVVVAAGNFRSPETTQTQLSEGFELNLLAMSENVISVAASSNNKPDGTSASFSSRGGDGFNPTLSADGTQISVRLDGQPFLVDGTSFSTPTVAAVVARMKERNPGLSFQQIKQILTGTAFNTAAGEEEEGAGILNIRGALRSTFRA